MKVEHRVEHLVWTAVMRSHNYGLHSAFKAAGFTKFTWVSPKSESSCEMCKSLDGIAFDFDDASHLLPFHPGCKCMVIPKV